MHVVMEESKIGSEETNDTLVVLEFSPKAPSETKDWLTALIKAPGLLCLTSACELYLVDITIDRLLFEGEQVFETAVGFYWVLRGLGVRPGWVVVLYSVAKHFTLLVPLSVQEYKLVLVNFQGSLMKC